jgi:murein L,D-transpeptidase YcbB/YkuD
MAISSRCARNACALVLVLACAAAASAQGDTPESELLRMRVEQIRDHEETTLFEAQVAARVALPELYERRGFTLAWTVPAARADLLRAIRDSEADGLDPEDYLLRQLEAAQPLAEAPDASLEARVDYDLLLTDALARLLYHLVAGKLDPHDHDPHWNFVRVVRTQDPAAFLQDVIDSGAVYDRIAAEKPDHYIYRGLVKELARHRELAARGGFPLVPEGPKLERGARGARVAALRARLAVWDEPAAAAGDGDVFDESLEAAVREFQRRHGLEEDGRVGRATLAALNVPVSARITLIEVNLERARWLLHDLAPAFVVVNVAAYEVYFVRDRQVVWRARTMVGKPYRETPIFRSDINYLVLNPTWTVPPGIFANDILPAQKKNPGYLAKRGLRVIDASGRTVPTASIDWAGTTPRSFRYMLRQDPGPDNALGRVKFMFPNAYAVYLHDTPNRAGFERSARAFSSGCIRVERPLELAELLLAGQPGGTREEIDAAIASGKTKTVTLKQKVPVLLAYWTAWTDPEGRLELRDDIYRRDPVVASGLAERFRIRRSRS